MSIFKDKSTPIPDDLKKPLAWTLLVLTLAASFALGFFLGRTDVRTPIVIETSNGR